MSWLRNLSPLIGLAALIGPMPQAASATERADITQLVVKFRDHATVSLNASSGAQRAQQLSAKAGAQVSYRRPMAGESHVFRLPRPMTLSQATELAERLAKSDPNVAWALPDMVLYQHQVAAGAVFAGGSPSQHADGRGALLAVPTDPVFAAGGQWHYEVPVGNSNPSQSKVGAANLPGAWGRATGSGVVVAVIDTGITPHEDLTANLVPGYDFISDAASARDGNGRDSNPNDEGSWGEAGACNEGNNNPFQPSSWHGTHVGGTVAAVANNGIGVTGVAYNARLLPLRALGACGRGNFSDIFDAIVWASGGSVPNVAANPNPARVVNLSLGSSGTACPSAASSLFDTVFARGTVVVASTGNDAAGAIGFPANCPGVIAVAAGGRTGERASFSNIGPGTTIMAPGVSVMSTSYWGQRGQDSVGDSGTAGPTYRLLSGTSMAAPHVAGVAALLLERFPGFDVATVRRAITESARAFPAGTECAGYTDGRCGVGLLDASRAMDRAQEIAASSVALVAATLPASRSVQVGGVATAFASVINTSNQQGIGCSIAPTTAVAATFWYQSTNPTTNALTGTRDTPVNIAAGQLQTFAFAFTPTAPFAPTDVQLRFSCTNSSAAPVNVGLNTLQLSATSSAGPDVIALAATLQSDGILSVPGNNGTGAFAVATANVGASATITVTADTGGTTLPVNLSICRTAPGTGACEAPPAASVTAQIAAGATPTFAVFAAGTGNIGFNPAVNRVFVRFRDEGNAVRGATSVAIRTQ